MNIIIIQYIYDRYIQFFDIQIGSANILQFIYYVYKYISELTT